jgi:hypothetical protein
MDSTGSIIKTVLELVRRTLDETDLNPKFQNETMVQKYLPMALHAVTGRLLMDTDKPIFMSHTIELGSGAVQRFILPPSIQEVHGLVQEDTYGRVVDEILPNSINHHDVRERSWTLEGNELRIDPSVFRPGTWKVLYVPSPETFPHYADGGTLVDASTLTLDLTPTLGLLDRRVGGYVGATVRILPAAGPIEERIVETHTYTPGSPGSWTVTFRKPLEYTTSGTVTYEIAPFLDPALIWAVVYSMTLQIGAARRLPGATIQSFTRQYNEALKAISDRISNSQARTGKSFYVYDWASR